MTGRTVTFFLIQKISLNPSKYNFMVKKNAFYSIYLQKFTIILGMSLNGTSSSTPPSLTASFGMP